MSAPFDELTYLRFLETKLPVAECSGAEPPDGGHGSLLPHQREICAWALRGGRRAVFASFGLGKTRMHLQLADWITRLVAGENEGPRMARMGADAGGVDRNVGAARAVGYAPGSEEYNAEDLKARRREMAGISAGNKMRMLARMPLLEDGIPLAQKYLIVAPLGVRMEFTENDGPAMGLRVEFVNTREAAVRSTARILITNYEPVRDGKLDPREFAGAGLDEGSVLRSYGSKTYQTFHELFAGMRFRYVFTATPSPNRYKELIHYGAFLGVMDSGQALTRFFQRDSSQANNLTLMPHMEDQFWHFLRSWACFIQSPADLGYDASGYDLPPWRVVWHRVEIDHTKNWTPESVFDGWGQGQLFVDAAAGLAKSAKVKRDSILLRLARAAEIMAAQGEQEHWLLWHDLEDERKAIERLMPEAVTVWGTQDLEERERRIGDFAHGRSRILATKPVIAGSGCNFQRHCARAIFLGVGYKFNDFIQAIHRIVRFQQAREVEIHIIHLDTEDRIVDELKAKWRRHDELVGKMTELLRRHRLTPDAAELLKRTIGVERREREWRMGAEMENGKIENGEMVRNGGAD